MAVGGGGGRPGPTVLSPACEPCEEENWSLRSFPDPGRTKPPKAPSVPFPAPESPSPDPRRQQQGDYTQREPAQRRPLWAI